MRRIGFGIVTGCLLCSLLSGCTDRHTDTRIDIRINEVLTAGGDTDWIELYNAGDASVNLDGCFLSDDEDAPGKWMFPEVVLEAGSYLLIYADKTDNTADRLSVPFALKASGETVVLSDPNGRLLDKVAVPESAPGVSYGRYGDSFAWYATPTPRASNENGMILGQQSVNTANGVRINEYMSRNRSVLYDRDGDYNDWVELYNFSNTAVDLSGYSLTDSKDEVTKWQFPDGTEIPAGGYLIVFCSDKTDIIGELHASFRLGGSDSFLGLYTDSGSFCSGVTYHATEQDQSVGYTEDGGYAVCQYPTPGYANRE
ncbi:MAG: lamin tail domain-containing protein [Clostridia bacterium]|nr:lamin tail domain-containing protein [Clostridia bacterium]